MKTVLFDLDGTLLPMDQDNFLKAYFGGLATKLVPFGYEPDRLIKAIWSGTAAMVKNDGSMTNEARFWQSFCAMFGEDARSDEPIFDDFYHNEFRFVAVSCGKTERAPQIISWLKQQGCRVVLATNPLFPAIATHSRVRWAGLEPEDFAYITTYENSSRCKPNPDYYREILDKLGLQTEECVMVGNDAQEDGAAAALGLPVFLLTDCLIDRSGEVEKFPHGGVKQLLEWLEAR